MSVLIMAHTVNARQERYALHVFVQKSNGKKA